VDFTCLGVLMLLVRRCTPALPGEHLPRTLPAQATQLRAIEIASGGLAVNVGIGECPPGRQQLGSIPAGTLGHSFELLSYVVLCRATCSAHDRYLQICFSVAFSALFC
jgi:hypothetical protein